MPVVAVGYEALGLRVTRGEVESLIHGEKVIEPSRVRVEVGMEKPQIIGTSEGSLARIQHSAATEPGMSGGPILNEQGQVVGMAYGVLRQAGTQITNAGNGSTRNSNKLYLAIAAPMIADFLNESDSVIKAFLQVKTPTSFNLITNTPIGPASKYGAGGVLDYEEIEFQIHHQHAASMIPCLSNALRRNRLDFRARALLAEANYQESLYPGQAGSYLRAAFYQAAWLMLFAPEETYAKSAQAFLDQERKGFPVMAAARRPSRRCCFLSRCRSSWN
jgi:S1-C subfamily serine protease